MSIARPFVFTSNTYAKSSEVNADFDVVYSQVNTNISNIAKNAVDIDNLNDTKANINGSSSQTFAVADAVANSDAINKQTMVKSIGNSLDLISGLIITKDSGSPDDTILVSAGSCYDNTRAIVLKLASQLSEQNTTQTANTTYYVYIIGNSTGSQTDIIISLTDTSPSLPSGYSLYRLIGYYTTDSENKIDLIYSYTNSVSLGEVTGMSMVPDYSSIVSKTRTSSGSTGGVAVYYYSYTAESNGYIFAKTALNGNGHQITIEINGTAVATEQDARGGGYNGDTLCAPVAKGNSYTVTIVNPSACYFIPAK